MQPTPPQFPGGPPGYFFTLPGGGAIISGTGSGLFDSSFFPIGFTATDISTPTATFFINGNQIRSGQNAATWDIAADLLGQTLGTWSVVIQSPSLSGAGSGPPPNVSRFFSYCVFLGSNSQLCNAQGSNTQSNPVFPTTPNNGGGGFVFNNVPSGRWFDPPFVNGFEYTGTGGTLFDKITLPTGLGPSFSVWTGGSSLGTFAAGAAVDFVLGGVNSFQVRDINPSVDAANSNAFPLQIFFEGGGNGSFTQVPLDGVPEPSTWLLVAAALPLAARRYLRR